jgi:hypothetical protein
MPVFQSPMLGAAEDPWTSLRADLELLWNGTRSEKIGFANRACERLEVLDPDPIDDKRRAWTMIDALGRMISGTDDAWVADRLAAALAGCEGDLWTPIFLELLEHPSPNLRWRAVQYFSRHRDPRAAELLEGIWTSETRPWVQRDLLGALTLNEGDVHADALRPLVQTDDPALAAAAISAAAELKLDESLAWILPIAARQEHPLRCDALDALSEWPESAAGLKVLLAASRDENPDMRRDAVNALRAFADPEAVERRVELLRATDEPTDVREFAAWGIATAEHPELDHVLLQILQEPENPSNTTLRRLAGYALEVRGIIEPPARRTDTRWTQTLSCLNYLDGPDWRVNAAQDRMSERCWGGPHIPGDPSWEGRIPDGFRVEIGDHFELDEEHWVGIGKNADCWVLLDVLEPLAQGADSDEQTSEFDPFLREIDLPVDELGSRAAEALVAAGFLDLLESGDTLAIVVIALDAAARDEIKRFLGAYVYEDTVLDEHLWDTLDALEEMYEDDPELGPLIEAALEQSD